MREPLSAPAYSIPHCRLTCLAIGFALRIGLILFVTLPYTAQATSATDDVRIYLIALKRLYEGLEYERALDQITLAWQQPRTTDEEVSLLL